jgi:hypothetical protein
MIELLKKFKINFNKYIIIDLDNVNNFQKKYVDANGLKEYCEFVSYENYKNYSFDNNNFLFSSYALSEISVEIRNDYFNNLLKHIISGFIVWNNVVIDFPLKYTIFQEVPLTSEFNKFIYF